jgi:hypothetical protein
LISSSSSRTLWKIELLEPSLYCRFCQHKDYPYWLLLATNYLKSSGMEAQ